jgi:DNA mismatch endonuclease (patch repair protein)
MSRIKSKWTTPERTIHGWLKRHKIRHKMHPDMIGNPDILLTGSKTVVFINGCFWHKCPRCYRQPKSNQDYWIAKIAKNVSRDKKNYKLLKKIGYKLIKIWTHELKHESWQKKLLAPTS